MIAMQEWLTLTLGFPTTKKVDGDMFSHIDLKVVLKKNIERHYI